MKRILVLLLTLSLLVFPVNAQRSPIEIATPQALLAIADDPDGSYILVADIDMAGIDWPCPAFSGTLDGNGYTILNLTITQPGAQVKTAYDGNRKPYDTSFAGLFSVLEGGEVKNLNLVNTRARLCVDTPCFIGSVAGYSMNGRITDCTVEATLELQAHDRMFGVGGLVGYGSGTAENCRLDVTLICTDTGVDTLDEQFMGGVLANGFMDIRRCDVKLAGYSSEYGYAHNGGLVGMYFQWPFDKEHYGKIVHNQLSGHITFFECNTDRRAYCKADVGEIVATYFGVDYNTLDFTRDERKEYDRELRPEMCPDGQYTRQVTAPGCHSFGYTQHTCTGCGYTFRDAYTPKSHSFGPWQTVKEPTAHAEGESKASCSGCGLTVTRADAYTPPQTTPAPATSPSQPAQTQPPVQEPAAQGGTELVIWLVLLGALTVSAVALVLYVRYKKRLRKRRRRRPNFK